MFYRYSNLGLLVLTSVGAMGRCLFVFLNNNCSCRFFSLFGNQRPAGSCFHMFGIREQLVSVSKVFFLKQKLATGSGYQKNHRRTGKIRRFSWHKQQPRTSSFSGWLPDPFFSKCFENHGYISEPFDLIFFFKPWLWTLRITLITCRGLEQFLIPMHNIGPESILKGFV